jgi:hypothetical protein
MTAIEKERCLLIEQAYKDYRIKQGAVYKPCEE